MRNNCDQLNANTSNQSTANKKIKCCSFAAAVINIFMCKGNGRRQLKCMPIKIERYKYLTGRDVYVPVVVVGIPFQARLIYIVAISK